MFQAFHLCGQVVYCCFAPLVGTIFHRPLVYFVFLSLGHHILPCFLPFLPAWTPSGSLSSISSIRRPPPGKDLSGVFCAHLFFCFRVPAPVVVTLPFLIPAFLLLPVISPVFPPAFPPPVSFLFPPVSSPPCPLAR